MADQGASADLIKNGTDQSFRKDVMDASLSTPVIVDFWAPWCGPCRDLTPGLEAAVKAAKGKVKLVKINIDENPAYAGQLGVRSIPNVWVFDKGRPFQGFMGNVPPQQLKMFVEKVAAMASGGEAGEDDIAAALEAADEALAMGDLPLATQIFAEIIQAEPENLKAIAGLARCYLAAGEADRAKDVLDLAPADKQNDPAFAGVKAALELAALGGGDAASLAHKLEKNPLDHVARYDLAGALAARGELEPAVEHLLQIIAKAREWNEGAARTRLLKIFDAAGAASDVAKNGRRRLSAILFS